MLEVALRVFGRGGYAGAGMSEIAREAGISAPALYRHYPHKKALYLAALVASGDRMFGGWSRTISEAPDAATAFARIGMLYQQMMRDEPHLLQIRFRAAGATNDPDIRELVLHNHARAQGLLGELAARADEEGVLPKGITQAILVTGFMAWGAMTDVTHHLGSPAHQDVFTQALRDFAAKFLGTHAASTGATGFSWPKAAANRDDDDDDDDQGEHGDQAAPLQTHLLHAPGTARADEEKTRC